MRSLRIAVVAPVWLPIPPETYGGTETIVALLVEHYRAAGHEVVLFASGDSQARSQLRSIAPFGVIQHMARREAETYEHYANSLASEVVATAGEFDVIHSHLGLAQLPILCLAGRPLVQTVHAPVGVDDRWVASRHPEVTMVTLTAAQSKPLGERAVVVHSGLDLERFDPSPTSDDHLVFLGRMGPGKNPIGAIEIAAAHGRELLLAGAPQNREERQYFRSEVEPLIDGERVRYVGPVDHVAKVRMLRDAAALLFPIIADEAFGLVMVEAMACGTPVLASRRGSVPEVVDEGVTGFVGDDVDSLAALVDDVVALDRAGVRRQVERRFSHTVMGDAYLSILEGVAA